jgi:hypothetical protein
MLMDSRMHRNVVESISKKGMRRLDYYTCLIVIILKTIDTLNTYWRGKEIFTWLGDCAIEQVVE